MTQTIGVLCEERRNNPWNEHLHFFGLNVNTGKVSIAHAVNICSSMIQMPSRGYDFKYISYIVKYCTLDFLGDVA